MNTGLSALLAPQSLSPFLDHYRRNEPLVIHGSKSFESLKSLPFLHSLESLLKVWPGTIQAHLPDVRDEISSIDTNSKDAQKLFNNGMGLLFNEAQHLSPVLDEWLENIKLELGVSKQTYGRCLIYATPDGKGTAPHFDQNINFVLQIHGTKIWTLAPNNDVPNPLTRHTMGQEPDPEMMGYLEAPLPTSMPKDKISIELKPGSLLFVPRGCWHETSAEGDALALNFTFTAPSWIDLFTAALRSRLALSPMWRETAHPHEFTHFDQLLADLVEDLPHWQARDILGATES